MEKQVFKTERGIEFTVEFNDCNEIPTIEVYVKGRGIDERKYHDKNGVLLTRVEMNTENEIRTISYQLIESKDQLNIADHGDIFEDEYITENLEHRYDSKSGLLSVIAPNRESNVEISVGSGMKEEQAWERALEFHSEDIQEELEKRHYKCIADYRNEIENTQVMRHLIGRPEVSIKTREEIQKSTESEIEYSVIGSTNNKIIITDIYLDDAISAANEYANEHERIEIVATDNNESKMNGEHFNLKTPVVVVNNNQDKVEWKFDILNNSNIQKSKLLYDWNIRLSEGIRTIVDNEVKQIHEDSFCLKTILEHWEALTEEEKEFCIDTQGFTIFEQAANYYTIHRADTFKVVLNDITHFAEYDKESYRGYWRWVLFIIQELNAADKL